MSTRICVFKDCHNLYSRVNSAFNDVTIFSFPKDAERAAQWRLLGQVHPKIHPKQLFMCSKHFDSKYLSITRNRTTLLGQAVPNAYKKEAENSNTADSGKFELRDSPVTPENIIKDEEHKANDSAQSFIIDLDNDQPGDDNLIMIKSIDANEKPEPKQFGVSIVIPSRKRAHSPTPIADSVLELLEQEEEEEEEQEQEESKDNPLIDSSEVTIFQLKSEEYVQMSRQYYMQEKRQMLDKLQTYKQILRNFKTQLMSLKDI